ncbi:Dor1-like family-domain-containing protein [Cokeromyces recurvatus]|uniref:Dor1-like family-domain-containing protein n=1 Tax=Cokeromyces recurvatus TaxID=90255 RepID=UPI00221F8FC5|nr:Dor1-like family-domain-containing protein [Cokeromyces recurvatus]KAI7907238.1 Dor1-like family-domain-containing protein [Cokeromyces recurvatus]
MLVPSESQLPIGDNNDELLELLADSWDNSLKTKVLDSKWTREYLTQLTSLPLNKLLQEPHELEEEQAKIKRSAQQLAFREYPSFLHAQTCRHQAKDTFDNLDTQLNNFSSSIPELQKACELFNSQAEEIKKEREKIKNVLDVQHVLTELLEIPQLMKTCVRNGYYSEAMDLASHVRLLQVRYPLSIVKGIQQEVQASSDLMLVQLISHLRKPIRLAAAMNVVGFLRRMDVFDTEIELRMVFLRSRHDFLQQRLARIKRDISEDSRQKSSDAFEYLKRFMDVMREQLFEIGTQYISIFSNEQSTLLPDYMIHVIELIKTTLNTYLPMIEDSSSLSSILTQLQYCGMSLGRIGLDFRHIFVHLFEEALEPLIIKWINTATEELTVTIQRATEECLAPSAWMLSKLISQQSNLHGDESRRHTFQPPMLLVDYPSLAIFTNGILSVFNSLRLLPAISLYETIQHHLESCFLDIGIALKQYCDQALLQIPEEMNYLQLYSAVYVRCCLPYLKSCLMDGIYGNLPVPYVMSEDIEKLLVTYLPVMEKEDTKEEDNEVNDVVEDKSKRKDVEEDCDIIKEEVKADESEKRDIQVETKNTKEEEDVENDIQEEKPRKSSLKQGENMNEDLEEGDTRKVDDVIKYANTSDNKDIEDKETESKKSENKENHVEVNSKLEQNNDNNYENNTNEEEKNNENKENITVSNLVSTNDKIVEIETDKECNSENSITMQQEEEKNDTQENLSKEIEDKTRLDQRAENEVISDKTNSEDIRDSNLKENYSDNKNREKDEPKQQQRKSLPTNKKSKKHNKGKKGRR